jgi:hypothetical protein
LFGHAIIMRGASSLSNGRLDASTASFTFGQISDLSNIFLHHVLDEWFALEVRPRPGGKLGQPSAQDIDRCYVSVFEPVVAPTVHFLSLCLPHPIGVRSAMAAPAIYASATFRLQAWQLDGPVQSFNHLAEVTA